MRIKFEGIKGQRRSTGCPVCGARRRAGGHSWVARKTMFLPSGRSVLFRQGIPVDVTDEEGKWLLMQHFESGGHIVYPFVEVQ